MNSTGFLKASPSRILIPQLTGGVTSEPFFDSTLIQTPVSTTFVY